MLDRAAATLARLYQKYNRDAYARRVLQRALYYHPDDATLGELRVKVAAGRGEEEGALRDLVRQFPDEPRYAIDLAALLVGQGRQKEARQILEPLTHAESPTVQAQARAAYLAMWDAYVTASSSAVRNFSASRAASVCPTCSTARACSIATAISVAMASSVWRGSTLPEIPKLPTG